MYTLLHLINAWCGGLTLDRKKCLLPLWWGGEWKEKGKNSWVWDKGSLREQQMKRTVITTILIRRICKTNSEMHRATLTTWGPARSRAATDFPLASSPTQNPAWWNMVLNTLFCLASLGQLAGLCPLPASGENYPCPGQVIVEQLPHS